MKIIAKIALQSLKSTIQPGETFEIEDEEAKTLIAKGFAKTIEKENTKKILKIKVNNLDNNILEIIDAIAVLDKNSFGKDNKPLIKALEKVLDRNITQEQRDQAWKYYEQDKFL